jgi:hypothetical protein
MTAFGEPYCRSAAIIAEVSAHTTANAARPDPAAAVQLEGQDAGALRGILLMALAAGALLAIGAGWLIWPVHPMREPDAG